ncbi:hypothetical protein D0Y65_028899 [Glycine soja]|uniref:Uncharacterized protein n=1 Tax=Glycine soja TaxID=3848 RepID=A0A445HWS6_GLYSO|nr:hypothetical protein D0Y65_028899 [Glycine soja]
MYKMMKFETLKKSYWHSETLVSFQLCCWSSGLSAAVCLVLLLNDLGWRSGVRFHCINMSENDLFSRRTCVRFPLFAKFPWFSSSHILQVG